MPEIIDSIRKQHSEVKEELAALPPPPTDNQTFLVHNLIRDFDTTLSCRLRGEYGHNDFQQALRRSAEDFQRSLKSIRPAMKVFENLAEENAAAAKLESPRKIRQTDEWFGDRDRESSPSLRKGRKSQQVEVHPLSSDEGPAPQSRKRHGPNELTSALKKMKKTPGSPRDEGVYSSNIFLAPYFLTHWITIDVPLSSSQIQSASNPPYY